MKLIARLMNRWKSRKTKLVNDPQWVSVYQSMEPYSLEIRKIFLEDAGIKTMTFDQLDSSYQSFGYIYLKVQSHDEERALSLLKENYD